MSNSENPTHGGVGGFFRSSLQEATIRNGESHQPQLVDFSDPAYQKRHTQKRRIRQRQLVDFSDQISVVPDHVHLLVRIVPRMNIEECALLLMNNGQHFIGKNYPRALVEVGVNQLWEASAYAGTCGELTTALLKAWLNTD